MPQNESEKTNMMFMFGMMSIVGIVGIVALAMLMMNQNQATAVMMPSTSQMYGQDMAGQAWFWGAGGVRAEFGPTICRNRPRGSDGCEWYNGPIDNEDGGIMTDIIPGLIDEDGDFTDR